MYAALLQVAPRTHAEVERSTHKLLHSCAGCRPKLDSAHNICDMACKRMQPGVGCF